MESFNLVLTPVSVFRFRSRFVLQGTVDEKT